MKIAFPTDDGITLSVDVNKSKGFLVLTVEGGEIQDEELRWINRGDIPATGKTMLNNLIDCSLIIVHVLSHGLPEYFKLQQIEVASTKEVIITKCIMEYLNTTLLRESNTCCSP